MRIIEHIFKLIGNRVKFKYNIFETPSICKCYFRTSTTVQERMILKTRLSVVREDVVFHQTPTSPPSSSLSSSVLSTSSSLQSLSECSGIKLYHLYHCLHLLNIYQVLNIPENKIVEPRAQVKPQNNPVQSGQKACQTVPGA